jgi:hypothetical protein
LCNSRPAPLSALRQAEIGLADLPAISNQGGKLEVTGPNYTWEYSQSDDTFTLWDSGHHCIVSGKMQPAVIVAPAAESTLRQCTPGKPSAPRVWAPRDSRLRGREWQWTLVGDLALR